MPRRSVLTAHQEIFRKICIASAKFTSVWRNSVFCTLKAVITPSNCGEPQGQGEGTRRLGLFSWRIPGSSSAGTCPRGWDWISRLQTHLVRDPMAHLHLPCLLHPPSCGAAELRCSARALRGVRQNFVRLQPLHIEFPACHKFP